MKLEMLKMEDVMNKDRIEILDVVDFMKLQDSKKENCVNLVPCNKDVKLSECNDFDVKVFKAKNLMFPNGCDSCDVLEEKFIGTGDPREPNFCYRHYEEVNKDSIFIRVITIEEKRIAFDGWTEQEIRKHYQDLYRTSTKNISIEEVKQGIKDAEEFSDE